MGASRSDITFQVGGAAIAAIILILSIFAALRAREAKIAEQAREIEFKKAIEIKKDEFARKLGATWFSLDFEHGFPLLTVERQLAIQQALPTNAWIAFEVLVPDVVAKNGTIILTGLAVSYIGISLELEIDANALKAIGRDRDPIWVVARILEVRFDDVEDATKEIQVVGTVLLVEPAFKPTPKGQATELK